MPDKPHRLETDLIHAGELRPRIEGAVTLPIFQTSTYEADGVSDRYLRLSNTPNHLGGSLDPHAAFLLHRGIKTLALRVEAQNRSALELAEFLQTRPGVAKVNYPGLKDHPDHQRASRLFKGFGGMLSFELHGETEAAERFLKALRLPVNAPSLGGVESLITRPATSSHAELSREERRRAGISEGLIRLSVGLEAPQDLIRDLDSALEAV